MPISLNLKPGPNTPREDINHISRSLVIFDTGLSELTCLFRQLSTYDGEEYPLERLVYVDLNYVSDTDSEQQEVNVSRLLDRIYRLHLTTVSAGVCRHGWPRVADALYFPNCHLPMRADLFSRVACQLQTRTVPVYA